MNGLDWQRAVQEISECVEYLRREGCEHVGVVGFCMGGALACFLSRVSVRTNLRLTALTFPSMSSRGSPT